MGKHEEAIKFINKGSDLDKLGKFEEALVCFDKAIVLDPMNAIAYINKGADLGELGKFEEAIECFDKALVLEPMNVTTYINKSMALEFLGNLEEAIKYFDIALDLESNNINANIGKGIALGKLGKFEDSLVYFDKVLALYPNNIDANLGKGTSLVRLDKFEEALIYFDKVLVLNPEDIDANYSKGVALGSLSKFEEALVCFNKILVLNPEDIDANYNKGITLGKLGKHEEALVYFDKALDFYNIDAYSDKLTTLYRLDKHDECHQLIQECITNNIISYKIFNTLYLFYKDNKDYEQDIEEYIQKTIAIESDKNSENTIVYQYSPFSKEIIYNITKQEIYFSNPSNFNDPFDPLIRILDEKASKGMLKLLNFRISCLSTNNKNILMWSHYANKHQGICIKYNIAKLLTEKDIIFKKTEYIKTMPKPHSGFHLELSDTTTIIDAFTQKHESWEYEEEYKLIVRTDKDLPVLKKCDIEAIYLGKKISPEDTKFIKNTVKNTDIKLYQMKINDHNIFELEEQEL